MGSVLQGFRFVPDGATTLVDALCNFLKEAITFGRLKGGAKTRMDFKGEAAGGRGPGFWETLVANAGAGLTVPPLVTETPLIVTVAPPGTVTLYVVVPVSTSPLCAV